MAHYKELHGTEFLRATESDPAAAIIDVRTPGEFNSGFIPGAVNIDVMDDDVFISSIKKLDKSMSYYVYCRSGGRSALACSLMADQGFTAFNLVGGISAWTGELTRKQTA
jgi:rhodanese-related sulfurtransferase